MNFKQNILIISVMFFAVSMFAIISTDMQEKKEKSVMQERARLQASEKEPLNKCIDDIDKQIEIDVRNMRINSIISPESYNLCMEATGHGEKVERLVNSGKMTLEEYCRPPSFREISAQEDKIRAEAKTEKEECYKRYK